ncbi:methylamine utilization protein MauE [Kribbella amoyensis]|uniref:Methylamine utilization protein MauE n=1 Tax=Kribbella amoyensis TaxID=996641 RepID=A0A561BUR1_9ACTN|nr:MauE/DoxX family redox-associated membrane protein [Kribbella amoyensis]TWD82533.1 methylamine utilization protein MauE [Kribbella amoyensis]
MAYVGFTCGLVLLIIMLASCLSKLWAGSFADFAASVAAVRLVPRESVRGVAIAVVIAEGLAVVLLAVGPLRTLGLAYTAVLLVGFTVVQVVVLRRGERVACRCFGASSAPISRAHVVRNLLMLAVGGIGLLAPESATGDPAGIPLAALVAVVVALLLIRFDDLVSLVAPRPRPRS